MNLAVGAAVVYGAHGVGRVTVREQRTLHDEPTDVVVVALEDGLTVTLPLSQALEQLRPVADQQELLRIEKTLRVDRELSPAPWLGRRNELQRKLGAADPVQLAEIVVEGAQREQRRLAAGNKQPLSPGERGVFMKARKILADEIAVARGTDQPGAEAWIEEQLARPEGPSRD